MPAQPPNSPKGRHTLNTSADNPHGTGRRWSWLKFVLFFLFGAVAGFSGGWVWFDDLRYLGVFVLIVALAVGALGGRYGDRALGLIMSIVGWVD